MPIDKIQNIDEERWFKHKAWDVINKVMHYDVEWMTIKNEKEEYLGLIFQSDIYKHNFSKWPPEFDIEQRLIILDYIKVKDSNGNKIFYFDLVKVTKGEESWVGVVSYNNGGCPYAFDVESGEGEQLHWAYFDNPNYTFELIGSVYENKELCPKLKYHNI